MNIIKYSSEEDVKRAITADESMLVVISFDGNTAVISQINDIYC